MNIKSKILSEIKKREIANRQSVFPVYDTEVIQDLKLLAMKKENYENEPVVYCKTCCSLHIKTVKFQEKKQDKTEEKEIDYCVACGSTDLKKAYLSEWEEEYAEKYGDKFLKEINNDEKKLECRV